jgi:hypothetical protein
MKPVSQLAVRDADSPRPITDFEDLRPERRSARSTIYRRPIAAPELFEADGHVLLLKERRDSQCVALRKAKPSGITAR